MNDPWLDQFKQQVMRAYPGDTFTFSMQLVYKAVGDKVTVVQVDGKWSVCDEHHIGWGDTLEESIETMEVVSNANL